jgi:hypothetical protein
MNQSPPDEFYESIDIRKYIKGPRKSSKKYKYNEKLEKLYWKIVKTHIKGKYNKVKSFLEKLSYDEIEQIESLEWKLADNLYTSISKANLNLNIGGDSSYVSLCYSILSYGEKIYYMILPNPQLLYTQKNLAHEGSGSHRFIMNYFLH